MGLRYPTAPLAVPSSAPMPLRIPLPASLLAATLVVAGCGPAPPVDREAFAGEPVGEVVRLPERDLPSMTGEPFNLAGDTRGRVTLLFIGYTYCPDVCPVHLANLAAVLADLPLEQSREVRTVFLTADPARDTPERLQEWLGALDRSFVGLRGTREEVNAVEDALGLPRSVVSPAEDPAEYFVGHAGQVLAFDREGVARLAYPWGIRQRDWRRDLPRLIRGEWPEIESTARVGGEGAAAPSTAAVSDSRAPGGLTTVEGG